MSKILISGDSFVYEQSWPSRLFSDSEVSNLSKHSAGNVYIADSIINNIDSADHPKFVFILWGTITKLDITLPITDATKKIISNWKEYGKINQTFYMFTGGDKFTSVIKKNYSHIKDKHWPDVNTINEYLNLPLTMQEGCESANLFWFDQNTIEKKIQQYAMLQYARNSSHLEDITYKSMILCQSYLEMNRIPYKFAFTVDPFDKMHFDKLGGLSKENPYYNKINWNNYIDIPCHNYGKKNNYLDSDRFHLTEEGMNNWVDKIKNVITTF